ncbi:orotate phosphoribosyltransferase [Phocea massiliensis]|uniref:Orotate phosphoribosyltransferase n=1 Tax=Merdimmobilis hominis TaxID=2897707 RepID=A0A938X767_9FIRM|nr:orotate phosphoribosyltransferase [Merdimmobilis hominis]MBM6920722.1 orotate phosphoribosyltransferase [Merdimmobilis hominis]
MQAYKEEFIRFMVRSGVLTFGDFTAKSGRKTPYFVNTGNYKTGEQIAKLGEFYASCIEEHVKGGYDALFGPAYKGIPLCVTAASALYNNHGVNTNYCFNRKEEKDHGEGGSIVGYKLKDGDRVLIVEDVVTAGTAVRETMPILKGAADVQVAGLIISVDRMEKGQGDKSAVQEIYENYGVKTYPLVTVREIIEVLYNNPVDGVVYIDDETKARMEAYLEQYGI